MGEAAVVILRDDDGHYHRPSDDEVRRAACTGSAGMLYVDLFGPPLARTPCPRCFGEAGAAGESSAED